MGTEQCLGLPRHAGAAGHRQLRNHGAQAREVGVHAAHTVGIGQDLWRARGKRGSEEEGSEEEGSEEDGSEE